MFQQLFHSVVFIKLYRRQISSRKLTWGDVAVVVVATVNVDVAVVVVIDGIEAVDTIGVVVGVIPLPAWAVTPVATPRPAIPEFGIMGCWFVGYVSSVCLEMTTVVVFCTLSCSGWWFSECDFCGTIVKASAARTISKT